jgi:hypothetical protein
MKDTKDYILYSFIYLTFRKRQYIRWGGKKQCLLQVGEYAELTTMEFGSDVLLDNVIDT